MRTLNEMYAILLDKTPESEFDMQVWSGLANSYYLRSKMSMYNEKPEQLAEVLRLAEEYGVSVPSKQLIDWLTFMENMKHSPESAETLNLNDFELFSNLKKTILNERGDQNK